MTGILLLRQKAEYFIKLYRNAFTFCFRIVAGIFIFSLINSIGLYSSTLNVLFKTPLAFPYLALSALLFAVLPPTLAYGLILIELVMQISSSAEVAAFVFLLLFCVIVFYARLQPKRSMLIIALIIGYYFKIPYAVVLFAGLYFGFDSIIPVAIGTFIYQFIPVFGDLTKASVASAPAVFDIFSIPDRFLSVYGDFYASLTSGANMGWIYSAFWFAMVIVATRIISRLSFPRSKEIAVVSGGAFSVVCGAIGILTGGVNINIFGLLVSTLFSVIIILGVRFFDGVLAYEKAERVQFEDEDNYYYVKIVPKLIIPDPKTVRAGGARFEAARGRRAEDIIAEFEKDGPERKRPGTRRIR